MTPYMHQLMEFMDACDRAALGLYCPACAKWGALHGFHDPWLLTEPQCGVLLCQSCAYLLVMPRGGRHPLLPTADLLRRVMHSAAGDAIGLAMKGIRLHSDGLSTLRFELEGRRG